MNVEPLPSNEIDSLLPWYPVGFVVAALLGLYVTPVFRDAARRFGVQDIRTQESPLCRSGEVLRGALKPTQCPAFGRACTPRTPLGATMVSGEGACAAYFHYGRLRDDAPVHDDPVVLT